MKHFPLFALPLVLALLMVPCALCDGAPIPIPPAGVELDEGEHVVRSMPHSVSFVDVNGTIWVRKGCHDRVTGYLKCIPPPGWNVTIEPSIIPFLVPGDEAFTARAVIPPGEVPGSRCLTIELTIRIPGVAPYIANGSCTIQVEGYRYMRIWPLLPADRVADDGTVTISAEVWNMGTLNDTCILQVTSGDKVQRLIEGPSMLDLPARSSVLVDLVVRVDGSGDGPSERDLVLTVRSNRTADTGPFPQPEGEGSHASSFLVLDSHWNPNRDAMASGITALYALVLVTVLATRFRAHPMSRTRRN